MAEPTRGPVTPLFMHTLEFPEGAVTLNEDETVRFFFRNMDYVYKRGSDATEGMDITISKESAHAIVDWMKYVEAHRG